MLDRNTITNVLLQFKIEAICIQTHQNRHFVFADLRLEPGNLKKIYANLEEIGLQLRSFSTPLIKLKSSAGLVQLQLTTSLPCKFSLQDLLAKNHDYNNFILGETIEGDLFDLSLKDDPHLLIAGTTGSGKSNLLHTVIANACRIDGMELHLIDPKMIEFDRYQNYSRVRSLTSNYTDACQILGHLTQIMEQRYALLRVNKNLTFPRTLVIIDELADLILQDKGKKFETALVKLAAKARACGIHLIVATQRPSVNVVTGLIKANFPARLACRVVSRVDSQIILDEPGAENLLGKGDALYKSGSRDLTRLQIALAE